MKKSIIKSILFTITLFAYVNCNAQQETFTYSNSTLNTYTLRIYDASNNLIGTAIKVFGSTLPTAAYTCSGSVASYIHIIDAGGCLWSITNLNSTTTCTTCTSCSVFTTTTPTFTCATAATTSCGPPTNEITFDITP